jgi:hypothetical protein
MWAVQFGIARRISPIFRLHVWRVSPPCPRAEGCSMQARESFGGGQRGRISWNAEAMYKESEEANRRYKGDFLCKTRNLTNINLKCKIVENKQLNDYKNEESNESD